MKDAVDAFHDAHNATDYALEQIEGFVKAIDILEESIGGDGARPSRHALNAVISALNVQCRDLSRLRDAEFKAALAAFRA